MKNYRVIAFDLDGTLTQHRSPLGAKNRAILDRLRAHYRLIMVGAGSAERILRQMGGYPIDIIGNYGMQHCAYDRAACALRVIRDAHAACDRERVAGTAERLRRQWGYTAYAGESVEFHPSGCVTFPLLGTAAALPDKLSFDPDKKKRRAVYAEACAAFPGYNVFVGGSSSFDLAPKPYCKSHALDIFCADNGLGHGDILYAGDDYAPGGNDADVYASDFPFLPVDDYEKLEEYLRADALL